MFCLFFIDSQAIVSFFLGKILEDDTAIKEYKINDKNFVVVVASKVCQVQFILVFGHGNTGEF